MTRLSADISQSTQSEGRRVVIFDIDHTLLDTFDAQNRALNAMMQSLFGVPADLRTLEGSGAGRMTYDIIVEILRAHGISEHRIRNQLCTAVGRLADELQLRLSTPDPTTRVLPGVPDVLEVLSRVSPLGVISGNPECIAALNLEWADLRKYFSIESFARPGISRAHLIKTVLETASARAKVEVVGIMVGDSRSDVSSARTAGVHAIGVTTGTHSRVELLEAGAELVLDTLVELPSAVAMLTRK
ncbi:MAG: HAD family hydrolase [Gemmatimonadaceae bacterium]|nr:HAD family hydrolase [Gemmatimonadaceae bacterium]